MKKIILIAVALALVVSLFAASCVQKEEEALPKSITIVDSAGRTVEVPQPLERIAVWNGAVAEVIRALGAADKIIAINKYMPKDDYYWPGLKDKPQIGSPWSIDYEKIVELSPQVLITYSKYPSGTELEEKLEPAGIKVVRLDCYGLEDEIRDIKILGVLLDREKEAEEFASFLQSKIDLVDERINEIEPEERERVYWEMGHKDYYTVAEGSAAHKRLCRAGGINVFAGMGVSYSEIDPEEILMKEPDVVIKDPHGTKVGGYTATETSDMEAKRDEMMNRAAWSELKAVKNGELYIMGDDLMGATDPIRLCYYAKLLYPDRFEDLDVEAFHREYMEKYQGLEFKGIYVYPCPWKAE